MKRWLSLIGVFVLTGSTMVGLAEDKKVPNSQDVAFAQRASDLMLNTLFAALVQEFSETTPQNVEEGKHSISLIFNDKNTNMRLVGALRPLSNNDLPQDPFEEGALSKALQGQATTDVQKVGGEWVYRRSVPLSNFHPACSMCHTNFPTVPNSSDWVGALILKVPIP